MRTLNIKRYRALGYATVTLTVIALTAVCHGIEKAGISRGYGALFFLIVVGSALWLGFWPSVYAAGLSATTFDFFFVPPTGVLELNAPLVFVATSQLIIATGICYAMQRQATVALVTAGKYWQGPHTDDWCTDSADGDRRGNEYLLRLIIAREAFLLGLMARDMIQRGIYGGAEAGFFHRISLALLGTNVLAAAVDDYAQDADLQHRIVKVDDDVKPGPVGMQ
jgi:hypothetical protein